MLKALPLRSRTAFFAALALCALALPLRAAVPGQVDFQGLLLDAGGEKVNGAVDLVFTLFDAPTGGSSLWTESHVDVQVADGVYGVTLGATTPLTQQVLSGGSLWLQIVIEGETLTPRRQLLAVPYAISAGSAENMGGVSGAFYTEMIQHFAFDGANPPNDDPSEGVADVDNDGLANFVDPDNDADGLGDGVEVGQGSDINRVTPAITSFDPPVSLAQLPHTITVHGQNFEPGISVAFGVDNPLPTNLTATSFDVALGPQPYGNNNVVVTRTNGESDLAIYPFDGRKVFLGDPANGNLGGVAGADARCAAKAAALALPGTFLAWIGDGTTSPAARFLQDGVPYERLDGTLLAANWADLTNGSLNVPIDPGAAASVWTGVIVNGTASAPHCLGWTDATASQQGRVGFSNQALGQWTFGGTLACSQLVRLYCFEQ